MGSVPHVELLERQSATASLRGALADATRGAGRMVFVSGEAGIGKTSLVRAFVEDLPRGTRVLSGACDDLLTPAPLGAIRDVARRTHGPLAAALAGSGDVAAAVLAELSAGPPTVLLVEDLHWADEATLDLLAFVARRIGDLRTAVILTYRDDEVGRASPLRRLLGAAPSAVRVALDRLSLNAVIALAPDRAVALHVHGRTRGNPFLVTELLHAGGRLPASVSESVLGRLTRLSEASRAFVEQLAVIPARAEPELLDVLQPGWADLAAPAEELGVLDVRDGALTFRHELARQAVEESLPGGRRIQLNRAVLAALLDEEPPDRARILHHADRCRDVDAVLAHGPAAARAAAAAGAHQQALAFREQVRPVADRLPHDDRAAFFEELAWEYYYANRFADAVDGRAHGRRPARGREDPRHAGPPALHERRAAGGARGDRPGGRRRADRRAGRHPPGGAARAHRRRAGGAARARGGGRARSGPRRPHRVRHELRGPGPGAARRPQRPRPAPRRHRAGDRGGPARLPRPLLHQHRARRSNASAATTSWPTTSTRGSSRAREVEFLSHAYTLEAHRSLLQMIRGEWAAAEQGLRELVGAHPDAGVLARHTLPVLARLLVRRGADDADEWLERAWELARRADVLPVLAPAALATVEHAWLTGRPELADEPVRLLGERLHRPGVERYRGELLRYLRRLGRPAEPFDGCPEEFAAGLRGDWRAAAAAAAVDPYAQALELAESPDPDTVLAALACLDGLGAGPRRDPRAAHGCGSSACSGSRAGRRPRRGRTRPGSPSASSTCWACSPRASPTRRSPNGWSSRCARWTTTCRRSSPSSASAPGARPRPGTRREPPPRAAVGGHLARRPHRRRQRPSG